MNRARVSKKQIKEYAKKVRASRLAEAASDIENIGQLKAALKGATQTKRDEQGKEALKDLGKGVLADLIPGGGTISSIFDLVKTTYSMDDSKRTGSALDALDVDDQVSAIVDDNVENAFINMVAEKIEALPDETPLSDLNMTKLLSMFLKGQYDSRTVAGFAEGKRMKITKGQLRRIIKEERGNYPMSQYSDIEQGEDAPQRRPELQAILDAANAAHGVVPYRVLKDFFWSLNSSYATKRKIMERKALKITKRQLRRIIKEQIQIVEQSNKDPDYQRGYDDGLYGKPVADEDIDLYMQGYDEGEQDAEADETGS